ncbi:TonB family protein [Comamonas terrigena]|nr:TonB family protein [Comamonas terrigena]MDH1093186.1 TonB family protein [Comamonas terrigena]
MQCIHAQALPPVSRPSMNVSRPLSSSTDATKFDFDIERQPLAAALYQYGKVSGQPTLFDASMLDGRMSTALHGQFTLEQALDQMLQGTGLKAIPLSSEHGETFLLKERGMEEDAAPYSLPAFLKGSPYPGVVQSGILHSLCSDPRTASGGYSALFRFQIDAQGRVRVPQLLGSTGDAQRDKALLKVLRDLRFGAAPPSELAQQTLTMSLAPGPEGLNCRLEQKAH